MQLFLSRKVESQNRLRPFCQLQSQYGTRLNKPEQLVWHERAKQLWLLKNRSYLFEQSYDPAHQCWVGKEKNTGDLILLVCPQTSPVERQLIDWNNYAKKIIEATQYSSYQIIIAVKEKAGETCNADNHNIYTSEAELLDNLIDFADYFNDIRYRVEKAKLSESGLTLKDTYTQSFYRKTLQGNTSTNTVEEYIQSWLVKYTEKQLAILGEYGQGKSTVSLLLSYHLIQQYQQNKNTRIPILIELRGKTLRTLTPEELLATWAYQYGVDVKALIHWHMAGKLLLIFEGFDEIDLSGDTEARISHFRTLWKLNYDNAKLIITGRPNFFLDSNELTRSLGKNDETNTIYLQPFNLQQIADSLRSIDSSVKKEIIDLASKDPNFLEVVSRPSLLYLVSILWKQERLSEYEQINSATVIDLFIKQTLKRQQDKHDDRPFMILNSAERYYFMMGIAAYMATKELPNQIDKKDLEKAVNELINAIPNEVSQSTSSMKSENSLSLRDVNRFDWNNRRAEITENISTDVRSCGLLTTDLSKDGSFKFAHKSYMELLQAKLVDQLFSPDRTLPLSIKNTFRVSIEDILSKQEPMQFFVELLKNRVNNDQANKNTHEAIWNIFFDKNKDKSLQWEKTIINVYSWLILSNRKSQLKITLIFLSFTIINTFLYHDSNNALLNIMSSSLVGIFFVLIITFMVKNSLPEKINKEDTIKITNFKKVIISSTIALSVSAVSMIVYLTNVLFDTYNLDMANKLEYNSSGVATLFLLSLPALPLLISNRIITTSYLWFIVCKMLKIADDDIKSHIGRNLFMVYEKHYLEHHK